MAKPIQTDGTKAVATIVPEWVFARLKALAVDEKRSMTKQLEIILTEYAEEYL